MLIRIKVVLSTYLDKILKFLGLYDDALKSWDELIINDPLNYDAYENKGFIYFY